MAGAAGVATGVSTGGGGPPEACVVVVPLEALEGAVTFSKPGTDESYKHRLQNL